MKYKEHIEEVAERGRENFLRSLQDPLIGMEAENLQLYDAHNLLKDYSTADNARFEETLKNMSRLAGTLHTESGTGVAKTVELPEFSLNEDYGNPAFTYDYGPQGEVETQPLSDLDQVANQKQAIEDLAAEASPEETSFYQTALNPNLMLEGEEFNDIIDWDVDENSNTDLFRNPALRYMNIEESYGKPSIIMGGAGGLQISGVPTTNNTSKSEVDDVVTDFMKGEGDKPGISAMNPLFYALTENSPLISEEGDVKYHARDDTYWHRHCRSPFIPKEIGENKYGFLEEIVETDSLEDIVKANSEKILEYTAGVPLGEFEPEDGGSNLHERPEYKHYNESDEFSLVLVDDDVDFQMHKDIVENESAEGYVRLEGEDEQQHKEYVKLDVSKLDNRNEFLWNNYLQAESMNKPNIRPRMGYGCFENRDADNNTQWLATLGIQAAKMRNWDNFQEAADEVGFTNQDAEYLREQHKEHGLYGKLHPDTEMTIIDFVNEYEDLFTDPINEPLTDSATKEHINDLLNGEPTEAEKAHRSYIENDFDDYMEDARVM